MEFLVINSTSHSFAALTSELSCWTLEEKFHMYARPSIILYIFATECFWNENHTELGWS